MTDLRTARDERELAEMIRFRASVYRLKRNAEEALAEGPDAREASLAEFNDQPAPEVSEKALYETADKALADIKLYDRVLERVDRRIEKKRDWIRRLLEAQAVGAVGIPDVQRATGDFRLPPAPPEKIPTRHAGLASALAEMLWNPSPNSSAS